MNCEDWWKVTQDSTCLFDIYKIYRDAFTRKTIRKALIFECILVVITAYMVQNKKIGINKTMIKSLYKIFNYAHKNFIHVICYVLHRMGLENIDKNIWAVKLREIIKNKSSKKNK